MTRRETRLERLEHTARACAVFRAKRWLHSLTDLELATLTATAPDLDAEIAVLLLVTSEDELRAGVL